jgi:hypothetical protein
MLPASATRPDAVIIASLEAIWPSLIPMETLAPSPQAELVDAIWTFQAPSKLAAEAGALTDAPASSTMWAAMTVLRRFDMTFSYVSTPKSHIGVSKTVRIVTLTMASSDGGGALRFDARELERGRG